MLMLELEDGTHRGTPVGHRAENKVLPFAQRQPESENSPAQPRPNQSGS
jgi:hypothetical protein